MRMLPTKMLIWVVGSLAAVAVASYVVASAIGSGPAALTPEEVAARLDGTTTSSVTSRSGPTTATTTSPGRSSVAPNPNAELLVTVPGTIAATCSGGMATLSSWSPHPGYRVDDVVRGPAPVASVWFESDIHDDVLVKVTCGASGPVATEEAEPDDHKGRRGRGRDHPEDD